MKIFSLTSSGLALVSGLQAASGYAFVLPKTTRESTSLNMVDQNVLMGGGIVVAGLVSGIGLVAFTEQQGERAKERGGGLSESMSTRIAGGLLEDMEVSSVEDLGSLTSQLEQALKQASGAKGKNDKEFEMTEESKNRIKEEAEDGW
jgi:uncharacterized protein HemX